MTKYKINYIFITSEEIYRAISGKAYTYFIINKIRESLFLYGIVAFGFSIYDINKRKEVDKMDKFILPEYDNSIVSLASSIRRYFELDVYHNTLSDIDKILEEYKPKNVVVILFDGMGSRLIKKY